MKAVQSGIVRLVTQCIKAWLYPHTASSSSSSSSENDTHDSRTAFPVGAQVGFITYDRHVHFYNLDPTLDQFQMCVVADVDDVFVPFSQGFLVDPLAHPQVIETFLNQLPDCVKEPVSQESVLGCVAKAVTEFLSQRGGRVLFFHSTLPSLGSGALKNRHDPRLYTTEKEKTMYLPQDPFYSDLAEVAVVQGVSFDLFCFSFGYMDMATLGGLATQTGGSAYYYPQFSWEKDEKLVYADLHRTLSRPFVYHALLRIRTSAGLRVSECLGAFTSKDGIDLAMGALHCDQALAITLKHDGALSEKQEAALQCALLYTSPEGQRRIRVHTLSLPTTSQLATLFRFAELDTTVAYLAKASVQSCFTQRLSQVRQHFLDRCVKVLASYRKQCASTTNAGQLILPETLKLFPLYVLALHKSKAFSALDVHVDVRLTQLRQWLSGSVPLMVAWWYPKMYSVHTDEPIMTRLSYERMEPHGVYFLENGQQMYLWIGRHCPSSLLSALFQVAHLDQVDHLPYVPSEPKNVQLHQLIQACHGKYQRSLPLFFVRQGMDPLEIELVTWMVEDKVHDNLSYVDFLVFVHRQIHSEIRGN
ncbi:COPII coat Sec23p-Sfb3p heterodimer component [Coelomomyces lativittatus]|nr:COPII coat Sec23p-Sfb3p heterodimer component [Coelomomyces lativittatus]